MALLLIGIAYAVVSYDPYGSPESYDEKISFQIKDPYPIIRKEEPFFHSDPDLYVYTLQLSEDHIVVLSQYVAISKSSKTILGSSIDLIRSFVNQKELSFLQKRGKKRFTLYAKKKLDSMIFIPKTEWDSFDDDVLKYSRTTEDYQKRKLKHSLSEAEAKTDSIKK